MSAQKKYYKREDVISKKVIDQDAMEVGSVKDTAFDSEGKLHLIVTKKEGEEEDYVSINDIKAFGDYILLKVEPAAAGSSSNVVQPSARICPKCGSSNSPNVGFCTKCGTKLI